MFRRSTNSLSTTRIARLLAAALTVGAAPASAHVQSTPSTSNRYVKVSLLGGGDLRIAYTVMIGEAPAAAERRRADLDSDGKVDEAEQRRYAEALRDAVAAGLHIDLDGQRVAPAWEPPIPGFSDGSVGPSPFSVDLVGRLHAASAGAHTVRLDDDTPLTALGETEIRIEESPGTRVVAGWQARDDGGRVVHFLWSGPKFSVIEDRSIGFRFVDERAARGRRLPVGLFGVLIGGVVAAAYARRMRQRRGARR